MGLEEHAAGGPLWREDGAAGITEEGGCEGWLGVKVLTEENISVVQGDVRRTKE